MEFGHPIHGLPDVSTVADVLGLLVPAGRELPSAGSLPGLPAALLDAALQLPSLGNGSLRVLHAYASRVAVDLLGPAGRVAVLEDLEDQDEQGFRALLTLCYGLYYARPEIADSLERRHGYPARPPQPLGYAMAPFDEALLAKQRERPAFWRYG